jgi:hypothetical protein
MKHLTLLKTIGLSIILLSVCAVCIKLGNQVSGMREVENKSQSQNQAPDECLKVFREIFAYIQSQTDIVKDEQAQNRWLTQAMRKAFVEHISRSDKPEENPDYPSNQSFIGVWNEPTTYSIVGSRHYNFRNNDNPDDDRAIIDVLYEWEENDDGSLDNQYPGEKFLFSFIFVHEDSAWKLDDIYTYDDEYMSPNSLRQDFLKQ